LEKKGERGGFLREEENHWGCLKSKSAQDFENVTIAYAHEMAGGKGEPKRIRGEFEGERAITGGGGEKIGAGQSGEEDPRSSGPWGHS